MSEETQKFLEAEKSANELLQSLQKLKDEAVSYKKSTDELDTVRQELVNLIKSVEVIAKDTSEVVKILLKIGGPEIFSRIDKLEESIKTESKTRGDQLSTIAQKLKTESEIRNRQFNQQKTIAIVGVSISILILIGVLILFFTQ